MEEADFDSPGTAGGGMPVGPDDEDGATFDADLLDWEALQDEDEEFEGTTE